MRRTLYNIIILNFALSTYSAAQQQDSWTHFTTTNGLANNFVSTVFEASDGALWFGTGGGLCRYQEGIWTTFTKADGLVDNYVRVIAESGDGALWFGTSEGISRYQGGAWTTFTKADGLIHKDVRAIVESSDGALWFGTNGGASRYQGGTWTTFTKTDGLAHNDVRAIVRSKDGALWFGTNGGVSRYHEGIWATFTKADGLAFNSVRVIIEASDGALWFGTPVAGVSRYKDGTWTTFNRTNGMATDIVWAIAESNDGAVWVANLGGVSRYHRGAWSIFTTANGLPDNSISAIIKSSDGALWFGTGGGGVSRYEQDIWTIFNTTFGLNDYSAGVIVQSKDGALWFGTTRGVGRYQEGIWTTFTTADGLAGNNVWAILQSKDGALWFGTDGGVSRYQEGTWTTFTTANGLVSNYINEIIESRDGALWFGTDEGISRYQEGTWTTFTIANGSLITEIIEATNGALWFGTNDRGVIRYHEGMWTTFTKADGLADNFILAIFESKDGALWFGTTGVSRYQKGMWTTFTTADGLASNHVNTIVESSDGALWFGTFGGGASRYEENIWTTFTDTEGLANNVVNVIFESKDGALWFGTKESGVIKLNPDHSPPHTFIFQKPEKVTGTSDPFFSFVGRDFRTPQHRLTYSYAVVDSSISPSTGRWQALGASSSAQTILPGNGKYTFYVRARDTWGNIDPTPATWTFTVDVTQPTVTINSHKAGEVVAGKVTLIGNAFDASPIRDFKMYEFKYGFGKNPQNIRQWKLDDRLSFPQPTSTDVFNDTLAIWDTNGLENGTYLLWLKAYDKLEHTSEVFLNVEVVKASEVVEAKGGANLKIAAGKLDLYIPANALPRDTQINVKDCSAQEITHLREPQITFANLCFEIKPHELPLAKPATLTVIYADSVVANKNEQKLALYHSLNGQGNWQRLGGSVHASENKIVTSFKTLGVFALYEDLTTGGEAKIFDVDIQPRVFSPSATSGRQQAAISFNLGKDTMGTLKVYNTAGRLIAIVAENKPMNQGNNVEHWDGRDHNGKYCPSGLYIVTIQAEAIMQTKTVVVMNNN